MSTRFLLPKARFPWRHLLAFGWMPSLLKTWCYRYLLRYKIGAGVSLGFGSAIVGENVEIGEFVEVGFLTIIRGRSIRIGRHTQIGATSYLLCEAIEIGEDAKINEQVFVGGPMLPESLFRLGSRTIVMQMSFLNPTKPLVIGDDSGIGGHCLIFTHGSWLNVLDGYPVTFASVSIGKSVWLPWRVFVLPGSKIGDGSVIGADSLVQGEIPPLSLAVGMPAKVIRTTPDFPRSISHEQRAKVVAEIMSEFNRFVTAQGVEVQPNGHYWVNGRGFRLVRRNESSSLPAVLDRTTVVLTEVALDSGERERLRADHVSWLDLDGRTRSKDGNALCEELALFLSRYGIRLARDA
jgi:acetyltransferase-like isoleucine patch superfamily enzyme